VTVNQLTKVGLPYRVPKMVHSAKLFILGSGCREHTSMHDVDWVEWRHSNLIWSPCCRDSVVLCEIRHNWWGFVTLL